MYVTCPYIGSKLTLAGCPSKDELALLEPVVMQESHREPKEDAPSMQSLLHSDLGARLPLHISLSRPVVLRTEQRSGFTELLQRSIETSHISPSVLSL